MAKKGEWAIGTPLTGTLKYDKTVREVVEILLSMPALSSVLNPRKPGDAVNKLPARYRDILKEATAEDFNHPWMAKLSATPVKRK
jgi:hypothetical protein